MSWTPRAIDPDGLRYIVTDEDHHVGIADIVDLIVTLLPVDEFAPLSHGVWVPLTSQDRREFAAVENWVVRGRPPTPVA